MALRTGTPSGRPADGSSGGSSRDQVRGVAKSVQRLKNKVAAILVPGVMGTWEGVRDTPNRLMRGWCGYFNPGLHYASDRVIEAYLDDRERNLRGASDAASPITVHSGMEIASLC